MKTAIVLLATAVAACAAPSTVQNAKRGTITSVHSQELDECVARGKRANDYAVYEACANEVDARFGLMKDAGVDQ